jgi:hypothetical protein
VDLVESAAGPAKEKITININKKVAYGLGLVTMVALACLGVASVSQDGTGGPNIEACKTLPQEDVQACMKKAVTEFMEQDKANMEQALVSLPASAQGSGTLQPLSKPLSHFPRASQACAITRVWPSGGGDITPCACPAA